MDNQIPSDEERAASHKIINSMHRANRFRLMFGLPLLDEGKISLTRDELERLNPEGYAPTTKPDDGIDVALNMLRQRAKSWVDGDIEVPASHSMMTRDMYRRAMALEIEAMIRIVESTTDSN